MKSILEKLDILFSLTKDEEIVDVREIPSEAERVRALGLTPNTHCGLTKTIIYSIKNHKNGKIRQTVFKV